MIIKPLTKETLDEAVRLTVATFSSKPSDFDYPGLWMKASLDPHTSESKKVYRSYQCTFLQYFVGMENGKVIGTTGVYTLKDDEKVAD